MVGPSIKILAALLNVFLVPAVVILTKLLQYLAWAWTPVIKLLGLASGWINTVTGMFMNLIAHIGDGPAFAREWKKTLEEIKRIWDKVTFAVGEWIFTQLPKLLNFIFRVLRFVGDSIVDELVIIIERAIKKLEGSESMFDQWKLSILRKGKDMLTNFGGWLDEMEAKLAKWIPMLESVAHMITEINKRFGKSKKQVWEEKVAARRKVEDDYKKRMDAIWQARKDAKKLKEEKLAQFNMELKQQAREMKIAEWRKRQRGETMAHWRERNRQYEIAIAKQKEDLRVSRLSKKEWEKEQKERKAQAALGLRDDRAARAAEKKRMEEIMKASVSYLTKQGKLKFNFAGVPLRADSLAEARKKWIMIQRLRTEGITDRFGKKWFFKTGIDIENMNRRITENLMRGGGAPAQQIKRATVEQKKFNAEVKKNPLLAMGGGGQVAMKAAAFDPRYQKAIIKRLDIAIQQRGLIYQTLRGKFVNQ